MERSTFGFTTTAPTKAKREEIGAIWEKTSKSNNKYMNVRFNINKKKLLDLIKDSVEGEEVKLSFVAFPNDNHNGVDARPNFRIYESIVKD